MPSQLVALLTDRYKEEPELLRAVAAPGIERTLGMVRRHSAALGPLKALKGGEHKMSLPAALTSFV